MKLIRPILILAVSLAAATALLAHGSASFDSLALEYEAIRQSLLHDTLDGVREHAARIEKMAGSLTHGFEPEEAGILPAKQDDLTALLPDLSASAGKLAAASDLAGAREAFGELSKRMVRFRQMTPSPKNVVVFCSMAKKVWLQPKKEIGNPYYGQSMAGCGEIVSE